MEALSSIESARPQNRRELEYGVVLRVSGWGQGEVRAASFTCNKEEYGKQINLGQSNIKFLVFSKLSNLTLSVKNYAETAKLEHCEVLLSVFFYFEVVHSLMEFSVLKTDSTHSLQEKHL